MHTETDSRDSDITLHTVRPTHCHPEYSTSWPTDQSLRGRPTMRIARITALLRALSPRRTDGHGTVLVSLPHRRPRDRWQLRFLLYAELVRFRCAWFAATSADIDNEVLSTAVGYITWLFSVAGFALSAASSHNTLQRISTIANE